MAKVTRQARMATAQKTTTKVFSPMSYQCSSFQTCRPASKDLSSRVSKELALMLVPPAIEVDTAWLMSLGNVVRKKLLTQVV